MWVSSPLEGGCGAVDVIALCRDPLECDSSGRKGVIHRLSVPPLYPPQSFVREGGIPGQ